MRQAAPAAAMEARGAPSSESGGWADGASEGVETEEGERRRGAATRCPRRHGRGPHGPATNGSWGGGRQGLVRRPRNLRLSGEVLAGDKRRRAPAAASGKATMKWGMSHFHLS